MTTVDWSSELTRTWRVLRTPAAGVDASPLPGGDSPTLLRIGVDHTGARHLLVPAGADTLPAPSESSISLHRHDYVFDGERRAYLDIGCSRPALFDLFDELLALLIPDVLAALDPAAAATTAIDRWRELLRASRPNRLSTERQLGLFAELWCLRRLAEAGRITSAGQWRGPLGEPHDLDLGDAWVEVKAVGPSSTDITVHGLEQLDTSDGRPGSLVVVELAEEDDGDSLPHLAGSILESGIVTPKEQFEDLLLASGALGADPQRRWAVTDVLAVTADRCPRLVPGMIAGGTPAGVQKVRYGIERSSLDALGVRGIGVLDELDELWSGR